jgi:hypothetical protein
MRAAEGGRRAHAGPLARNGTPGRFGGDAMQAYFDRAKYIAKSSGRNRIVPIGVSPAA